LLAVFADGVGQVDDGGDAGSTGAGEPSVDVRIATSRRWKSVRVTQFLLEDTGAEEHVLVLAQLGNLLALVVRSSSPGL
jgi:hypothetical protein